MKTLVANAEGIGDGEFLPAAAAGADIIALRCGEEAGDLADHVPAEAFTAVVTVKAAAEVMI